MKKFVLAAAVLAIILTCISGCGGKSSEFDAKILASINVNGLNGKGTINVSPDNGNIRKVCEAIEKEDGAQRALSVAMVLDAIDFETVDEQENLSNGDIVKIKATYPESAAKDAKVKFINTEFTYTVEGLKEGQVIDDLFEEIELIFEGISPSASVEVVNRSEEQFIRNIQYSVSPKSDLHIGDNIVVVAEIDEASAEANGYILPDVLEKKFTVEGIDEYTKSFEDIDEATKSKMINKGISIVQEKCEGDYNSVRTALGLYHESIVFEIPELTNIYFYSLKPGEGDSRHALNAMVCIYKVVADAPNAKEPHVAYASVMFRNLIKRADGNIDLDNDATNIFMEEADADFDVIYNRAVTMNEKSYEIQEITP